MARVIAFLCSAPSHKEVKLTRETHNLTIHEGKWAVCPSASPDGHEWEELVNGLNYDDLFERRVLEHRK